MLFSIAIVIQFTSIVLGWSQQSLWQIFHLFARFTVLWMCRFNRGEWCAYDLGCFVNNPLYFFPCWLSMLPIDCIKYCIVVSVTQRLLLCAAVLYCNRGCDGFNDGWVKCNEKLLLDLMFFALSKEIQSLLSFCNNSFSTSGYYKYCT